MKRWFWLVPSVVAVLSAALWPHGRANAGQRGDTRVRYVFPSIGFIRGEILRVSMVNPNEVNPGPCRILLVDAQGNQVGDTGTFNLPAVQTPVFDFDRAKLDAAGEGRTGRLQVHVVVFISNPNGCPSDPSRPGVELIEGATGHTFALQSPPEPDRF